MAARRFLAVLAGLVALARAGGDGFLGRKKRKAAKKPRRSLEAIFHEFDAEETQPDGFMVDGGTDGPSLRFLPRVTKTSTQGTGTSGAGSSTRTRRSSGS